MSSLLIIGAGQYGMVVKEIAEFLGYEKIGFLDDNNPIAIGGLDEYTGFTDEYGSAAAAIGNAEMRMKLLKELEKAGYELPVLIHNKAYVSPSARIGAGTVIEPMAVVNTDTEIGIGCIISAGAIINHNCIIGDGCHIDCGTVVGARTVIKAKTNTKYGEIITG